ncbi:MAG TPA: hypothetical protein DCX89_00430 [Saprospirales bacterium]|nr:hypothetical protein [Saprospirales bacterium]HAY70332.1 hypothetical protein [Saprospirales bacterium]HCR53237.1 hypothetical protein [Cytophagales bacterium]HRQ29414.1 hypothetical protein [Saprospiraceae bacterium]
MNDRIKYILNSGDGINWLGITIFVVFFILFLAVVWITLRRNKDADDYMAEMPINEKEESFE